MEIYFLLRLSKLILKKKVGRIVKNTIVFGYLYHCGTSTNCELPIGGIHYTNVKLYFMRT